MNTTNKVLQAIAELNLEPIKNKLMDADHGEGWSRAKADAMEVEYRRFLHLMHAFPNETASPTKAVDTFWHYHILDTQKYAADCDDVFGCFMHHNPYGEDAGANTGVTAGDRMQELYEATFGEAYIRPEVYYLDLDATAMALPDGRHPGSGAQAAVCHTLCMVQAKPASAKAAVCQSWCMMQGKQASPKQESAKAPVCQSWCMMQAKPASAQAAVSATPRTRQKTRVGGPAPCA